MMSWVTFFFLMIIKFDASLSQNHWTGLWTGLLDWTDGLDYLISFLNLHPVS